MLGRESLERAIGSLEITVEEQHSDSCNARAEAKTRRAGKLQAPFRFASYRSRTELRNGARLRAVGSPSRNRRRHGEITAKAIPRYRLEKRSGIVLESPLDRIMHVQTPRRCFSRNRRDKGTRDTIVASLTRVTYRLISMDGVPIRSGIGADFQRRGNVSFT